MSSVTLGMGAALASGGWRLWAAVAAAVLALAWLGGCFREERSAAAVCRVFKEQGGALHDHYQRTADAMSQDTLLTSVADLLGAPGRIADLMSKLAAVAPEDIQPTFQTLADTFREIGKNEAHPFAGLLSNLALSVNAAGAFDDANAYVKAHCEPAG